MNDDAVIEVFVTRRSRSESWRLDFIMRGGGRCHYCNRSGSLEIGPDDRPWHVDHMHALARGGSDDDTNLVLACKRCNLTKGVQDYQRFKSLARSAFWVPDDWRVSEFDLDNLMEERRTVEDGDHWVVDVETYRILEISRRHDEDSIDPVLGVEGLRAIGGPQGKIRLLQYVAEMHRLLPAMVAEIRMLRGEAAEGCGS